MTDTERIAVELLGWIARPEVKCTEPGQVAYSHQRPGREECLHHYHPSWGLNCICRYWPDLTNWNDIRRMEDALMTKNKIGRYAEILDCLAVDRPEGFPPLTWREALLLRASPAQRVAACIAVLDEIAGKP